MAKVHLTQTMIQKAEIRDIWYTIRDDTPGLIIRVGTSGSKVFYRDYGVEIRFELGTQTRPVRYPSISKTGALARKRLTNDSPIPFSRRTNAAYGCA